MNHTSGPIWRKITDLGLPALGSVLLAPLYSGTDSAIMGHVGKVPLAALALATGFINFWTIPLTSIGFAITSRAANLSGRGEHRLRDELGMSSAIAMGMFALVAAAAFALSAPEVSSLLAHSKSVARATQTYLELASAGIPGLFIFQTGTMFLTGVGRTRQVLALTGFNVGLNVIIELVLVFGAHLSVAGSAIGTDIAETLGAVIILRTLHYPGSRSRILFRVREFFKEFFEAAAALAIRTFALVGALSGSVFIASQSGDPIVLGSFQIGQQVWLIFGLSFDAIAVPAQVLVGEWLAKDKLAQMKHWTWRLINIGWITGIVLAVLMIGLSGFITGAFTNITSVASAARISVVFAAAAMPITAVSFVIDGLVGGLERFATLRTIMLISLAAASLFAALSLLIPSKEITITRVWWIFLSWLIVRGIASLAAWRTLLKSAVTR